MRSFAICSALLAWFGQLSGPLSGTTLQQLSLDDLILKSSQIVRGKVLCTGVGLRGSTLYTNYRVQVSEQWKGTPASQLDFAVPGGFSNGMRQTYAGSPSMSDGQDVLLFLWSGKSGLIQILGLSQGLFSLSTLSNGQLFAARGAATERMVDANGQPVQDTDFAMPLSDLRARVAKTLSGRSK